MAAKDPNVPTNFDSLPVSFLKKLKIVCGPARGLTEQRTATDMRIRVISLPQHSAAVHVSKPSMLPRIYRVYNSATFTFKMTDEQHSPSQ